jgi:hypothetical protein
MTIYHFPFTLIFTFLYHRNTVLWVLTMSKTVSVLYETGTDYLSRAHMFISISVCMVSVYLAHLFMFPLLCFLFCLSSFCVLCPMLPVSLDCSFSIAPSIFSDVYLPVSLDCSFSIAPSIFSDVYLPVSPDCSFCIAPSIFSDVYLPVSLDCLFSISPSIFSDVYLPMSLECPFSISPSIFSNA